MNLKSRKRKKRNHLRSQSSRCAYCHCSIGLRTATLDHLLPRYFGGSYANDNVCVACRECNRLRGVIPAPLWSEFVRAVGYPTVRKVSAWFGVGVQERPEAWRSWYEEAFPGVVSKKESG